MSTESLNQKSDGVSKAISHLIADVDPSLAYGCNFPLEASFGMSITDVDQHAQALKSALARIQHEIDTRVATLHRQRNQLIPLGKLPPELLSDILVQSTHIPRYPASDNLFMYGVHSNTTRLQELASVCQGWWHTVLTCPGLWTVVMPGEVASLHLLKSGSLPLTIQCTGLCCSISYLGNLHDFIHIALRHSDRWRDVAMEFQPMEEPVLVNRVISTPLPMLESFRLILAGNSSHPRTSLIDISGFAGAPNLRHLQLERVVPLNGGSVFIRLESLTIKCAHYSGGGFAKVFHSILSHGMRLRSLTLSQLSDDAEMTETTNQDVIQVPTLERLDIMDTKSTIVMGLVGCIRLTDLQSLCITCNDCSPAQGAEIIQKLLDKGVFSNATFHGIRLTISKDDALTMLAHHHDEPRIYVKLDGVGLDPSLTELLFPILPPLHFKLVRSSRNISIQGFLGLRFIRRLSSLSSIDFDCHHHVIIGAFAHILLPTDPPDQDFRCSNLREIKLNRLYDEGAELEVVQATSNLLRRRLELFKTPQPTKPDSASGAPTLKVYDARGRVFDLDSCGFVSVSE